MRGLVLLALQLGSCHARKRQQIVEEDGSVGWTRAKKAEIEKATAAEAHERHRREKAGLAPLPLFPTHTTTCSGRACRPGEGNMKGYQMWSQASSYPPEPEPEPEPESSPFASRCRSSLTRAMQRPDRGSSGPSDCWRPQTSQRERNRRASTTSDYGSTHYGEEWAGL